MHVIIIMFIHTPPLQQQQAFVPLTSCRKTLCSIYRMLTITCVAATWSTLCCAQIPKGRVTLVSKIPHMVFEITDQVQTGGMDQVWTGSCFLH